MEIWGKIFPTADFCFTGPNSRLLLYIFVRWSNAGKGYKIMSKLDVQNGL